MNDEKLEQIKERMNKWVLAENDPDTHGQGLVQSILDIKMNANDVHYLIELVEKQKNALMYLADRINDILNDHSCFGCAKNSCADCIYKKPESVERIIEFAMKQNEKQVEKKQ